MMTKDWPVLACVVLGLMGALAAAAFLLLTDVNADYLIAAAIGFGILAQTALVFLVFGTSKRHEFAQLRGNRDLTVFQSEIRRKTESLQTRYDRVQQSVDEQTAQYASGLAELRASYASLQEALQQRVANVRAQPVAAEIIEPVIVDTEPPPIIMAQPSEPSFADRLNFALEPIVDVQNGRTVHYRMHASALTADGELATDKLLHYAGRVGKRAELDLISLREAQMLADKLRERDADLKVFVSIGAETLANADAVAAIAASPQQASGIVYEMPHAMLAGLSERGLEGLAALARHGAHFALANVSISGLDLQAMNTLNVRHVGVAATGIDPSGPSTALIGFAQMARLSRVSVIVMGLSNQALVGKIGSVARFACGPCFAEPRRVKRNLTSTQQLKQAA